MRMILAPMQGVIDPILRELLTEAGGIDRCVTEFVRVTNTLYPRKVFLRYCPELENGGCTSAGTPVYLQLLGGDPAAMADNAGKAASLGASGIDLNFGCPAPQVNRNDGGSILLKAPRRLQDIATAVRRAVPRDIPVTAKLRLGFDNAERFMECCEALIAGGVDEITVHARTRSDGYKPPAYWDCIRPLSLSAPIPVIANGEIWSPDDARRCQAVSGTSDLMLGRGMLARPDLARRIRAQYRDQVCAELGWESVCVLLERLLLISSERYPRKYAGNRTKQWLAYLRRGYWQASITLEALKRLHEPVAMLAVLRNSRPLTAEQLPMSVNE